jgi:hypothetical protein
MRESRSLQSIRPFIVYDDGNVKESRRLLHLGIGEQRRARGDSFPDWDDDLWSDSSDDPWSFSSDDLWSDLDTIEGLI